MKETVSGLNQRIARRVGELRAAHGLALDALARKSGVSRSMISLIERGESSPTATVLDKLAAGLGVTLPSLFDPPNAATRTNCGPVARRDDQSQWTDPASGYIRRNVSPPGVSQPMKIVEVHFPPGGRVTFGNHRARQACASAVVGPRRLDEYHAGNGTTPIARRRLSGHATRRSCDVP